MAKLTVKLNSAGVIAILKDPQVAADLAARADRVQQALPTNDGEVWDADSFQGRDRAQAIVRTANAAARNTSAETNALLHGLSAGK